MATVLGEVFPSPSSEVNARCDTEPCKQSRAGVGVGSGPLVGSAGGADGVLPGDVGVLSGDAGVLPAGVVLTLLWAIAVGVGVTWAVASK